MAKFEYNDYDERCVMHCPTQESADIFLSHLSSIGESWCTGRSYIDDSRWYDYEEETCYLFSIGEYGDYDYFESEGYEILEFYDFEWGEIEPDHRSEITMSFEEMLYGVPFENQTTI